MASPLPPHTALAARRRGFVKEGMPASARSIADECVDGILEGNRTVLARAITLIESNAARHAPVAERIVREILPRTGRAIRVGITGVPGVGKSTFIEALGCRLCASGRRVAVLAVDPTSTLSRGSILGDKTRMETLAREPNCFIRPSPSGATLGGVARKTRESILLCEAAGFDVVMVETVGVGQSETAVRSMVDFFLVLMLAGAGDELQGIKKGLVELADALVVTKADGANRLRADTARAELARVLHFLTPPDPEWRPPALTCSSTEDAGIAEVWSLIESFQKSARESGLLDRRRRAQTLEWMRATLRDELWRDFSSSPAVRQARPGIESAVLEGALPPSAAVRQLLRLASPPA